ncbi:MAG TPA: response regulator [Xanthobacteraceae bacterium]|nr:response regulator [Xanthobacteraceae bacterium]
MPEAATSQDASASHPKADPSRLATIRLLQGLAVAALLLPLLVFLVAGGLSYRASQDLAHERIERSLDVTQEQVLKVFQSMHLALDTIDHRLGGRSAAQIKADEQELHLELRQIQAGLPEVQSIWIFGPAGEPQVITREVPAPSRQSYADQDYFIGPRDGPPGVYIGGIHHSVSGGQPYFTFSRARRDADGGFLGVIEMSLLPSNFSTFYSHLASSPGVVFELVREDGVQLARFPPFPDAPRLDERSGFRRSIAADATLYTAKSQLDGVERLVGLRRVPGYPVYVTAGIATAQIRNEWLGGMAVHLIFGLPATAFLFSAVLVVLQRTRRLHAEQDRREQTEAIMRQTQRLDAVGRLTGGVAHDFNNLLMIIIGNLETIQRQIEGGREGAQRRIERAAASAMQGAKRAATLTQRLLAFARLHPLDPRPLDLNKLLNDLSDFLTRTLGETVSLEVIGAAGLWAVAADQTQLETALLNLAANARDAMPEGGKLTIETGNTYIDEAYAGANAEVRPGQYVMIAVSDSGSGMSRETAEQAFEPFFTTKPAGQGTGLGLSQVYGFVKQSGGHVKIYSELGEGTTIKMYLPRLMDEAAARNRVEGAEPVAAAMGSGERILVVEDDGDVRQYIVDALRGLNFQVSEAPDGKQALSLLDEHRFDLLLTDVILPGMNGRQLADTMKAARPGIKVLFMTGYSRNAIVHHGRLDPGVHMLQKPVTSAELARKIRELLGAPAAAPPM